jgi:Glycosyl hydrolases family 38 N-terminal domain
MPRPHNIISALVLASLLSLPGMAGGQRHFVIVSKTHFDIGYSALARDVEHEYRTTMIDRALATIEAHGQGAEGGPGYVWTVPGWPMRTILWEGQHPERKKRVEAALQRGNLVLHALPFTLHSATGDVETLARGFGYANSVAREYGLDFPISAKMTDVPGHDWIVPTLLAQAGVKFFHFGSNPTSVQVQVPRIFWWEGPDGSRVLTMFSNGYDSGLLPPADWPHKTWLAMVMSGDNQGPHTADQVAGWIKQIRSKFPDARITMGSMDDFAESFLAEEPELPVVRGTISDSWIHGPMSSPKAAIELMNVRPKLRAAEALRTLNMIWGTKFVHTPKIIAEAYAKSLRWSEHTWGLANQHFVPSLHGADFYRNYAAGLTPNYRHMEVSWTEHDQFALRIQDEVIPTLCDDLNTLAENVSVEGLRVVVYNALPWVRDGIVAFAFPFMGSVKGYSAVEDVQTGAIFPLKSWGADSHRNGQFIAKALPPLGYRTYVFVREEKELPQRPVSCDLASHTLENAWFKVVLDPNRGCIASITEKQTGRERVDPSAAHGFGQYLYQQFDRAECDAYVNKYILPRYHGSHCRITGKHHYVPQSAKHVDFSPGPMKLEVEELGDAVKAMLIPPMPENEACHTAALSVTLYNELPYLDLQLHIINHPATENPEAGWLCLPLKVDQPEFRLKGPGSVFDPAKDVFKGSNFAYFWTQGGLAVLDRQGGGMGIALPDCPAVSLGVPGIYRFQAQWDKPKSHVYVNLFNNKWNTNFRSFWQGNLTVRARLWAIDQYAAEKDLTTPIAETLTPLLAGMCNYGKGRLPATAPGLSLSRRGVLLTALGPNPDGQGTLLRVWEDAGQSGPLTITLPEQMQTDSAQPIDLRGRPLGRSLPVANNNFTFELGAFQPASFLMQTGP